MKLWSDSFRDGEAIPADFAFARIDSKHHVEPAARGDAGCGGRPARGVAAPPAA